jgi:hypothetical protein
MSIFLFGDFESPNVTEANVLSLKRIGKEHELFVWLDDEIEDTEYFTAEIKKVYPNANLSSTRRLGGLLDLNCLKMLGENPRDKNTHTFFISSFQQPLTSDDVLEVWERYSTEVLFPNGSADRAVFNYLCAENLIRLRMLFEQFIVILQPTSFRVLLPEYDCDIPVKNMTVNEMVADLIQQLTDKGSFIDSAIYDIMV